ncbi:MAG: hypothetical protein O7B26_09410, partial [Planctomycetota bacterium]|nr:hypothetical protein [Planctomycetota bacterium]
DHPVGGNTAMLRDYDLERMADGFGLARSIGADIFCSQCEYPLLGLPYRGRCPECGWDYSAKALWKDEVISGRWLEPPVGDYAAAVALILPGLLSVVWGLSSTDFTRLGAGAVLVACGLVFACRAWIKTARFIRIRRFLRMMDDDWE